MPAAKHKKRAAALREVWTELRRYIATLMSQTGTDKEMWARVEARVNQRIAETEARGEQN